MLSKSVTELINILFKKAHSEEVKNSLESVLEGPYKEMADRVCCSVLKLSVIRGHGSLQKFRSAFELTKLDYRDLFVKAKFANSERSHELWAQKIKNKANSKSKS